MSKRIASQPSLYSNFISKQDGMLNCRDWNYVLKTNSHRLEGQNLVRRKRLEWIMYSICLHTIALDTDSFTNWVSKSSSLLHNDNKSLASGKYQNQCVYQLPVTHFSATSAMTICTLNFSLQVDVPTTSCESRCRRIIGFFKEKVWFSLNF